MCGNDSAQTVWIGAAPGERAPASRRPHKSMFRVRLAESRMSCCVAPPPAAYGCCRASSDEGCFRAHDTEFVSLGIGENGPGLVAGLADVDMAGAQPQ